MLKSLDFHLVGPAPHLGPVEFGERLNLLTGDNGLGKSLLLDTAWWALTGMWPEARGAWPREESTRDNPARLLAVIQGKTKESPVQAEYNFDTQSFALAGGRPAMPGLVLYFRNDGRFSLWDPAKHYWRRSKTKQVDDPGRPDALHLAFDEVWNPILSSDGKPICRGLIEDWVTWQSKQSEEFKLLERVLEALSPSPAETLKLGDVLKPFMLYPDDAREHPTLMLSYGRTPVMLASAAMKRILAVAYLLVWTWHGHQSASGAIRQDPERRLVILFDEPETHLHPQWQRRLLPALMDVAAGLAKDMKVQLLVSTHAPLVLASVETRFDSEQDRLFHFELDGGPHVESVPFTKHGDVGRWLVSPLFGLAQARSVEAENAIKAAQRFMRGEAAENPEGLRTEGEIHQRLLDVLGGSDSFWPRWIVKTGRA